MTLRKASARIDFTEARDEVHTPIHCIGSRKVNQASDYPFNGAVPPAGDKNVMEQQESRTEMPCLTCNGKRALNRRQTNRTLNRQGLFAMLLAQHIEPSPAKQKCTVEHW